MGIIVGVIGGILFGVFGGIFGLLLSIIGIIYGINAKNAGDDRGHTRVICGFVGAISSSLFILGFTACSICYSQRGVSSKYRCAGYVGASCQAKSNVEKLGDEWEKAWNDALKDIDWNK